MAQDGASSVASKTRKGMLEPSVDKTTVTPSPDQLSSVYVEDIRVSELVPFDSVSEADEATRIAAKERAKPASAQGFDPPTSDRRLKSGRQL